MTEPISHDHIRRTSSSDDAIEPMKTPRLTHTMSAGAISISPEMFEKASMNLTTVILILI